MTLNLRYCAQSVGALCIELKVFINVDDVLAQRRFTIPIFSKAPFNVKTTLLNQNNEVVISPLTDTDLFLRANVETTAALIIGGTYFKPAKYVQIEECRSSKEFTEGHFEKYDGGDILCISGVLGIDNRILLQNDYSLGQVCIKWKRNEESKSWVVSQMELGSFRPRRSPLVVSARIGAPQCVVRIPISIYFSIRSLYHEAVDLSIKLEMAEMFMFAGYKQIDIRLLASETYECRIVVMALNAGRLPFPKLQLHSSMIESSLLEEVVWLSVPSSIFVLPYSKR